MTEPLTGPQKAHVNHVTVRNGLTLAYVVALINTAMALMIAFGVELTSEQQAAFMAFVNAAVMVAARVLKLPEKTPDGGTVEVAHVPLLVTTPPTGAAVAAVLPAVLTEPEG